MLRAATCCLLAAVLLALGAGVGVGDEAAWRDRIRRADELVQEAESRRALGDGVGSSSLGTLAFRLLEEAEAEKPGDARVALLAVRALVCVGNRQAAHQALAVYESRAPRGKDDPDLYLARALVAFQLDGRPDLAVLALEQRQRLAPDAADPMVRDLYYRVLMAEAAHWRDRKDCEHALPLLEKAVKVALALNDAHRARLAWSRAGVTLSFCNRLRESEKIYRRLIAEEPQNPLWHFNLGLLVASQARPAEAIPSYERTLALLEERPVDGVLQARLQQVWLKLGNCHRLLVGAPASPAEREAHVQAARKALEHYMDLAPRDARGPLSYGLLLYRELDLPLEALEQFRKARELDPVCDASLQLMIQIAHRHGPKPTGDAARDAEARAAWAVRLRAWERDFEENEGERRRIRKQREAESPDKSDGCI